MSADKSEYYKEYYEKNKERIREARRRKYEDDNEHAEKCRQAARDYRERMRKSRPQREGPITRPRRPVMVQVNGAEMPAYTVGKVSSELNRSIQTLNHWKKAGLFPDTPYRSRRGDRLYTAAMIYVVKTAVFRRGQIAKSDKSFKREIESGWREIGIPVNEERVYGSD